MSSVTTYSAFKTFLAAQYPALEVFDFDEIDEDLFGQVGGAQEFLVIEESTSTEDNIGFGDSSALCFSELGVLIIHYFSSAALGSNYARQKADTLQGALRGLSFASDGIRVTNADPPDVTRMEDGLWDVGSVVINYERNFQAALQPQP